MEGTPFPKCLPPVKTLWLVLASCRRDGPLFLWTVGELIEVFLEPCERIRGDLLACRAQERVAPAKNCRPVCQIKEWPLLFHSQQVACRFFHLIRIVGIDHHVVDL